MSLERIPEYDTFNIPAIEIYYDTEFNCRGEFTISSLAPLADSIDKHGLEFPVVVQPSCDVSDIPKGFNYRLVAGHRRFKAMTTVLKWQHVPAQIRNGLSPHQAKILNITENLQRMDLNPLEEAYIVGRLHEEGMYQRQIAAELGRDQKWVLYRLKILKLPEEVRQMVAAKRITLLDVEIISQQPPHLQLEAALAIEKSKRGRGKRAVFEGTEYRRSFRRRRRKVEIVEMIRNLMDLRVETKVSATRALAWAAGFITDDELAADFEEARKN